MTMSRFAKSFGVLLVVAAGWAVPAHAQTITSVTRTPVTVTYWMNEQLDKTLVRVNGSGTPGTKYIVETSRDGTRWWPVSAAQADATTGAFVWETHECSNESAHQYRLVASQAGYSTQPQGRLTETAPGTFELVTEAGWKITISKNGMIITAPPSMGANKVELWGSVHENLNGKHTKDIFSHRRSYLLEDGTLVTACYLPALDNTVENPMSMLAWISIYDAGQSHRIDMQTLTVAWSALTPALGEDEEYDGETARIYFKKEGRLRFDNVSDQGDPCGPSPEKIPAILPLGETGGPNNPNNVNDYFDDRRLGHT
jgi:hypothetical protein